MPNVLQAVPAVVILDIIRRSVTIEPEVETIFWTNELRCDARTCGNDDLANFFWPKLMKVRMQIKEANEEELYYLKAKLCANSEEVCTHQNFRQFSFFCFLWQRFPMQYCRCQRTLHR